MTWHDKILAIAHCSCALPSAGGELASASPLVPEIGWGQCAVEPPQADPSPPQTSLGRPLDPWVTPTRSAWKSGSPRCRKQIVTVACHGLQVITQRKPTDTLDQALELGCHWDLEWDHFYLILSTNRLQVTSQNTAMTAEHRALFALSTTSEGNL